MAEYPCWGSLSFHGLVPYGSQSRHLGRVDPDPFSSRQQDTDRAPVKTEMQREDVHVKMETDWCYATRSLGTSGASRHEDRQVHVLP